MQPDGQERWRQGREDRAWWQPGSSNREERVAPHSHVVDKNWGAPWEPAIADPGQTTQPRVPAPGK